MTTPEQHAAQERQAEAMQQLRNAQSEKDQGVCPWVTATLTRCYDGSPLVVLTSEPFNGLEIRPSGLRQLAVRLGAIADMAGKLPTGGKYFKPTKVVMGAES
jgi:hypothetical protein